MTKRVLHGLTITKIAAVDIPCQEGAVALIAKGLPTAVKIARGVCEAIRKAGFGLNDPDGDEGAAGFAAVLADEALTQQFWDTFYKATDFLRISLLSIIKDDSVADKQSMVAQSLKEFAAFIGQTLPGDIGKALAAGIAATYAGDTGQIAKEKDAMFEEVKKRLGLDATATEADVLKSMAAEQAKADEKVEKMTDPQTAYMGKMAPADREGFQKASAADREKKMKDEPKPKGGDPDEEDVAKELASGSAFKTPEGAIVRKAKVGDDVFAIVKSLNDRAITDGAELAKAREEKIAKEFEDIAAEHGFAKTFAPTLRKALQGADLESRAAVLKEMKALRAQADAGGVFKELGGKGDGGAGTAGAELYAKAAEMQKSDPKLSPEQAFSRVYKARENAPIVARYRAEQAGQA